MKKKKIIDLSKKKNKKLLKNLKLMITTAKSVMKIRYLLYSSLSRRSRC